ncbi:hypothetical protein CYMTET_54826 [Cymbomonas tetramitiformis]|uniref:Uncharacterized protein n=1 Tax=Cymbomonas tetramitiformis TaxID=36881 RepID=A0AAE0BEF7_9CHLO|nr:hypothetical protein CYMTET_54826 [Cymbomonas tetramitiformis]
MSTQRRRYLVDLQKKGKEVPEILPYTGLLPTVDNACCIVDLSELAAASEPADTHASDDNLEQSAACETPSREEPEVHHELEPEVHHELEPEVHREQELEVHREREPELDREREPELDREREPEVHREREPELDREQLELVHAFANPARNATQQPVSIPEPTVVAQNAAMVQPTPAAAALGTSLATILQTFRRLSNGKPVQGLSKLKKLMVTFDFHSYGQLLVIGDFVPGKELRIVIGQTILEMNPTDEGEEGRWRMALAAAHEEEVVNANGGRERTGKYEFVLDSHPTHHDQGHAIIGSEQLSGLDVCTVPTLKMTEQWQLVNNLGALVPEGEGLRTDIHPSVPLPSDS